MEEEIEERLKKIYNFEITVEFLDFRQYNVIGIISTGKQFKVPVLYDGRFTLDGNISSIVYNIDNEIVKLYKNRI